MIASCSVDLVTSSVDGPRTEAPGGVVQRRSRSIYGLAVLAVVVLTACGDQIPPRGEEAERARTAARQQVTDMANAVTGPLPRYGGTYRDACAGGQNNWLIRDDYKYFCGVGSLVLVGTGEDLATALRAVDRRASTACPAWPSKGIAGSRDLDKVQNGAPAVVARTATACGEVNLTLHVLRAADPSGPSRLEALPASPGGAVVEDQRLDGVAALRAAQAAGHVYVLAVETTLEYARKQR